MLFQHQDTIKHYFRDWQYRAPRANLPVRFVCWSFLYSWPSHLSAFNVFRYMNAPRSPMHIDAIPQHLFAKQQPLVLQPAPPVVRSLLKWDILDRAAVFVAVHNIRSATHLPPYKQHISRHPCPVHASLWRKKWLQQLRHVIIPITNS
jgi:hypothetical protein